MTSSYARSVLSCCHKAPRVMFHGKPRRWHGWTSLADPSNRTRSHIRPTAAPCESGSSVALERWFGVIGLALVQMSSDTNAPPRGRLSVGWFSNSTASLIAVHVTRPSAADLTKQTAATPE